MTDRATLEDFRQLRDSARALVDADLARLKEGMAERSIPSRAMDRASEGTADLLEQVSQVAGRNKGLIATLIAGVTLWLARHPLIALLDSASEDTPPTNEQDDRS